jgi:hypothetical protein
MRLRIVFLLGIDQFMAYLDHSQFVVSNSSVKNLLFASRCIEMPSVPSVHERNGRWPILIRPLVSKPSWMSALACWRQPKIWATQLGQQ